jgi:hypothetical protein
LYRKTANPYVKYGEEQTVKGERFLRVKFLSSSDKSVYLLPFALHRKFTINGFYEKAFLSFIHISDFLPAKF